jgi:hypothetical protein
MDGKWEFTVHTYMGDMKSIMEFAVADGVLTGKGTDGSNGTDGNDCSGRDAVVDRGKER